MTALLLALALAAADPATLPPAPDLLAEANDDDITADRAPDKPISDAACFGYTLAGALEAIAAVATLSSAVVLTTPTDPDNAPLGFGLMGVEAFFGLVAAPAVAIVTFIADGGADSFGDDDDKSARGDEARPLP